MIISVIGPSGSGKGTLAKLLSEKLGIPTLSAGALIRNEIKNETEYGHEAKDFV